MPHLLLVLNHRGRVTRARGTEEVAGYRPGILDGTGIWSLVDHSRSECENIMDVAFLGATLRFPSVFRDVHDNIPEGVASVWSPRPGVVASVLTTTNGENPPLIRAPKRGTLTASQPGVVAGECEMTIRLNRSLTEATTAFQRELQRLGVRDSTRAVQRVKRILKDMGVENPADLTEEVVRSYMAARRSGENPISASTHDNILANVAQFSRFALGQDVTASIDRVRSKAREAPRRDTGAFTFDEARRIWQAAVQPERAFYCLLWYTALRVGCARQLTWTDVDLANLTLTIRPETDKTARNRRLLPLHPEAAGLLARIQHDGPRIWSSPPDQHHLTRTMRAAGVPYTDPQGRTRAFHAFRKGCLTHLEQSGVPLSAAQMLAGHQDIRTTMQSYIKPQTELVQALTVAFPVRGEENVGIGVDTGGDVADDGPAMIDTPTTTSPTDRLAEAAPPSQSSLNENRPPVTEVRTDGVASTGRGASHDGQTCPNESDGIRSQFARDDAGRPTTSHDDAVADLLDAAARLLRARSAERGRA